MQFFWWQYFYIRWEIISHILGKKWLIMSSQQMHHAFSLVENKTEKLSYLVYQKKPRSVSIYNFGIYIHLLSFKKKIKNLIAFLKFFIGCWGEYLVAHTPVKGVFALN